MNKDITATNQINYNDYIDEIIKEAARRRFINFARYVNPKLDLQPFHLVYYTLLDMFAHGKIRKMIVQQPPQHGKQISDNEIVVTPYGIKKHGDLVKGDYVFGRLGQPVKVLWVSPKTRSEYIVKFSDGAQIECHGNHEWVVYNRNKDKEITIETKKLATETLQVGKSKRNKRYKYLVDSNVCVYFKHKNTLINPYTLGAWLGDGQNSSGLIHIGLNDIEIINNSPYEYTQNKGTTTQRFYSKKLNLLLQQSNLLKNKHIPDEYIYNSVDVRTNIIAGLIDTDGYVNKKTGRVKISNTNKLIVDAVAFILRSLGQAISISETEPCVSSSGIIGRKKVYEICFNPSINYPTVVPRKKIKKITPNRRRAIVSVTAKNNLGYGNCIQVEGGIYLVGNTFVPTHNSEGNSRLLPAYMLGLNPDTKVCIGAYAATIARDFNRDVQRIIDSAEYGALFPKTFLNRSNAVTISNVYLRNSEVLEMVNHKGSLRVVGRGGSLTSKTVDVSILDDVYKDYAEGNSPIVREAAWKWYTTVVRTRLHNNSQELISFTRWHEDDLIGRLEQSGEKIINITQWSDLENIPKSAWVRINFEAIKTLPPTDIDPREPNTALWEQRHSLKRLLEQQALDPIQFQCLYQGNPSSAQGRLYQHPFKTWIDKSDFGQYIRSGCYIDVADEGSDFLFAATYDIYKSDNQIYNERNKRFEPLMFALITDMIMTDESTEVTTVTVPAMINRNGTQLVWVESNSGGAGFEKVIKRKIRAITKPFAQHDNKEARIITASGMVTEQIVMPFGWETRYKAIYEHLTTFLRNFKANTHDDAEDGITGIYERELQNAYIGQYDANMRGIRLRN